MENRLDGNCVFDDTEEKGEKVSGPSELPGKRRIPRAFASSEMALLGSDGDSSRFRRRSRQAALHLPQINWLLTRTVVARRRNNVCGIPVRAMSHNVTGNVHAEDIRRNESSNTS